MSVNKDTCTIYLDGNLISTRNDIYSIQVINDISYLYIGTRTGTAADLKE